MSNTENDEGTKDNDDIEGDGGTDGTDGTEDAGNDWTPPTREEWEKQQNRYRAATQEAATRRKLLTQHGIDPRTGERASGLPGSQDGSPEVAELVEKARLATDAAQRAAIRHAIRASGVASDIAALLLPQVSVSELTFTDDDILGLDEQLDALREKYPSLFIPEKKEVRRPTRSDGERRKAAPAKKASYGQALLESGGFV